MDEQAIIGENVVGIHDGANFVEFNCKKSPNYFTNLVKYSLLLGAEKVLMGRKSQEAFSSSSLSSWTDEATAREKKRNKGKSVLLDDKLACGTSRNSGILSSKEHFNNELSFDITSFLAISMLKLFGFQMSILVKILTFPIFLMNLWIKVLTLPFNTLTFAKENFKKQLMNLGTKSWLKMMSFVFSQIKAQKSLLKLSVRFCWALFWAAYVCFLLVGLLVMGFVVSGLTMRRLLEEPIETTKALNFDYTKTSPVAYAPLASNGLSTPLISKPKSEDRPIPYNHKLQLTVSLTMPESEYNRKLGIFQVRVDCLSANGKVTATSSYPSMLKFKSEPIRLVETAIKSVPLVTGFQSEVQNLKLVINDFTEGFEPTACFKVVLEKRAEYQPHGAGIPEIYAATLHVEIELPKIKKIIWIWRRTVFVWIGIFVFLSQLSFSLIFCRTLILPRRRITTILGNKKNVQMNKISW
ncbi:seipin-2-like [Solanum dulcamara]|uniref:seipin-2-like n=1 Tax=Solanum dulcamara TaxID=45834 RepID=UPI002485231C|nr:seipin-2-like [Solanum dulcamara]